MKKLVKNEWFRLLFWIIFPLLAYQIAKISTSAIFGFLAKDILKNPEIVKETLFLGIFNLAFFGVMLGLILWFPAKIFGQKISKKTLGTDKPFDWADYGGGILGFVVSILLAGILNQLAQSYLPGFSVGEKQDVGFSQVARPLDMLIAFFCLTILPAFVEEIIFRGAIYGSLREIKISKNFGKVKIKIGGWILAMIIASVLFGYAHGQLNVALTTFAMSVVMCVIREKLTDSIWAGVVLHFLKNSIAFFLLYGLPILQLMR